MAEPLIRNISDTAFWAAIYRARETERPNPLFRDPFARRLAGTRGDQIADSMPDSNRATWAWVTRTYLFDKIITEQIAGGVDLVLNLAAGLDARPYRMSLPATLQWVEVDMAEPLAYKEEILRSETPRCQLERVVLDLAQEGPRRELFERFGDRARKVLIITEGLLIYLSREEVAALATELARQASFQLWTYDIGSPGLVKMLAKSWERQLDQANAPFKFAPPEGPGFFREYGWQPLEVHSMLKTAAKLRLLSLGMRLLAMLPDSKGKQGSRPWSAVGLLGRSG